MNDFRYLKDINFEKGRYYIGASEVPTLAGLNKKYGQSTYQLWREKTGRDESFTGNQRTYMGHMLEPVVLSMGLKELDIIEEKEKRKFIISAYRKKTKFKKSHLFTEAHHPERPYIMAHADLINTSPELIIEGKTTGFFGAKRKDDVNYGYDPEDFSQNGIPSNVYLQLQTQMLCYGIDKSYVSVLIDTGIHKVYGPVLKNKKVQENIIAICERFWWHVEKDKEPKPEIWDDVVKIFPDIDPESKTVVGGIEQEKIEEAKFRAAELRKKKKKIDEELEDIKNSFGIALGGNKYLESAEGHKLATASDIIKYNLKNYKEMDKELFDKLLADGFINKSEFRTLRF